MLPVSRPTLSGLVEGVSLLAFPVPLLLTGVAGMGGALDISGSSDARLAGPDCCVAEVNVAAC
jgi:hypothetical protein